MELFQCPYLGSVVELSDNRLQHIRTDHHGLPADLDTYIAGSLASPDLIIRKPQQDDAIQFYRWYYDLNKYMVVVVIVDTGPRYWAVTAYAAHRTQRGERLWSRN